MTEEELVHHTVTFLIAGHDTTSNALSWTIYLLARHPDIATRLRSEIWNAVPHLAPGAADRSEGAEPIPAADQRVINGLPFLDAVCKESLRMYPTAPVSLRVPLEPQTLESSSGHKYHLPAGKAVMVNPWVMHHLPHLWPAADPEEFVPDRWLGERAEQARAAIGEVAWQYRWIPFMRGPHDCVGQRFAMLEIKVRSA